MRHFSLAASAAAVVLLTTACADTPARLTAPPRADFIVNGQPTGNAYGNVGALMIDYDQNGVINGDDELCSGSLITPTIFLTAAHCVAPDPITPVGTQFYVSFSPDLYAKSFSYITATGYVWDPQYGRSEANLHDLALVFLPRNSTRGITPLQLPPAGYLDQLKASGVINSLLFVNVGYGTSATLTGNPGFPYDGKRSFSKSEFMGLQPTWLGLLMNSNSTGLGGDCYGDSGGPKFIDGNTTMIVATVTTGDYNCRATTWDWRLDTPEARGFLKNYVTLP
ncbi:MAG TPA: trypsin-like serine protease [Gemmatimonadaceae bacterium]|nr:trypsin-like serine protease [Gemmatimonadaceae bacterium]